MHEPPPRRQRPIVLAAAGGMAALGLIAAVALAVCGLSGASSGSASSGPAGSTAGSELATEGMNAPGTRELRALGCDPAIVLDAARLLGGAGAVRPGEPRYIVTCDVPGAQAPTCERAAGAYFGAAGGSVGGNVEVRVGHPGGAAPLCAQLYAPSGAALR